MAHTENKIYREAEQFETLLFLIREHRKTCDGKCSISLYFLIEVAENIVKRKLTMEETRLFI